jgi:cellulose synthase/poly-beta-1,6-N-acetylglucosamine synthase-like glycosyltransferase
MNFELFLILVTIAYILLVIVFILGIRKPRDNNSNAKPFVSVVIAARNEETNLPACLDSVLHQTYPSDLFEVIVINDNSTDNTVEICTAYMKEHANLHFTHATENTKIRGKANALACGIDIAVGEVILITDADCRVPPTWIEHTARRYTPDVGLIGGVTLPRNKDIFTGIQALDWAFTLAMAASTAALGHQHGSIGNNLSFRKKAYDEVGGYRNLKFSVTEDYTIVQAIINSKKWNYLYPIDPLVLVVTEPCTNFKALLRQKHRWGKGALDMKPTGFLIFVIGLLMHISPFIVLYWGKVVLAATTLMCKFTMDYIFLYKFLKKIEKTDLLRWFYYFEFYFIFYVIFLPLLVFFGGKVKWKERTY